MLKILFFFLLHSSLRIFSNEDVPRLWTKLRNALNDINRDTNEFRKAQFTCCLYLSNTDYLNPADLRPLCSCWKYKQNSLWKNFQIQRPVKVFIAGYEGTEYSDKVYFYLCKIGVDAAGNRSIIQLKRVSGRPWTKTWRSQKPALRDPHRICTWMKRKLRKWQLIHNIEPLSKTGGKRHRRSIQSSTWGDLSLPVTLGSLKMSTNLHPSPDLRISAGDKLELSYTLQNALQLTETHYHSATHTFVSQSSYELNIGENVNFDPESLSLTSFVWNEINEDVRSSFFTSLMTSDAGVADDTASIKLHSAEASLAHWHELAASLTSMKSESPGSEEILVDFPASFTPSLSDKTTMGSFLGNLQSTLPNKSDFLDSSPIFSGNIHATPGSEKFFSNQPLILQSLYNLNEVEMNNMSYIQLSQLHDSDPRVWSMSESSSLDASSLKLQSLSSEGFLMSPSKEMTFQTWVENDNQGNSPDIAVSINHGVFLEPSSAPLSLQSQVSPLYTTPLLQPHVSNPRDQSLPSGDGIDTEGISTSEQSTMEASLVLQPTIAIEGSQSPLSFASLYAMNTEIFYSMTESIEWLKPFHSSVASYVYWKDGISTELSPDISTHSLVNDKISSPFSDELLTFSGNYQDYSTLADNRISSFPSVANLDVLLISGNSLDSLDPMKTVVSDSIMAFSLIYEIDSRVPEEKTAEYLPLEGRTNNFETSVDLNKELGTKFEPSQTKPIIIQWVTSAIDEPPYFSTTSSDDWEFIMSSDFSLHSLVMENLKGSYIDGLHKSLKNTQVHSLSVDNHVNSPPGVEETQNGLLTISGTNLKSLDSVYAMISDSITTVFSSTPEHVLEENILEFFTMDSKTHILHLTEGTQQFDRSLVASNNISSISASLNSYTELISNSLFSNGLQESINTFSGVKETKNLNMQVSVTSLNPLSLMKEYPSSQIPQNADTISSSLSLHSYSSQFYYTDDQERPTQYLSMASSEDLTYVPSLSSDFGDYWFYGTSNKPVSDGSMDFSVLGSSGTLQVTHDSYSPEVQSYIEVPSAIPFHSSQETMTEWFSSPDVWHMSSAQYNSQHPVFLSTTENLPHDVHAPVMESRTHLNDSEIIIDRPLTEALSFPEITRLVVTTASIFDLASNGPNRLSESPRPTLQYEYTDKLLSSIFAGEPVIYSNTEKVNDLTHGPIGSGDLESSLVFDNQQHFSSPFYELGFVSSRSADSMDDYRETIAPTGDHVVFAAADGHSYGSYRDGPPLTVFTRPGNEWASDLSENSASLILLAEVSELPYSRKDVFTFPEELYVSQSGSVTANIPGGDSKAFLKTVICSAEISTLTVPYALNSVTVATSSGVALNDRTIPNATYFVSRSESVNFSLRVNNMNDLSQTDGVGSKQLHFVTETVSLETHTSEFILNHFSLFDKTVEFDYSKDISNIHQSSVELWGMYFFESVNSSPIMSGNPSFSEKAEKSVIESSLTLGQSTVAFFSSLFSTNPLMHPFSSTHYPRLETDVLHAPSTLRLAGSSLSSPPEGSNLQPPASLETNPSPSSDGLLTDFQGSLSTIVFFDTDIHTSWSNLQPRTSVSSLVLLNSAEEMSSFYGGTLSTFHSSSQGVPIKTKPDGVSAQKVPDTSSVSLSIPSLAEKSTAGGSVSFKTVFSSFPLKQYTQQLPSPPTAINTFSLAGDYPFTLPVAQEISIDTKAMVQHSLSRSSPDLPSLLALSADFQPPLRTEVLMRTLSLSLADSSAFSTIGSYSKLPLHTEPPFITSLPTPPLPETVIGSSATGPAAVYQSSVRPSSRALSVPAVFSQATLGSAESHVAVTSPFASTSPSPLRPTNASAASPSIQQENLLEVTLRVNSTVNVFGENFQATVSKGLQLTFLQAAQLNRTRARRANLLITVEIFSVNRLTSTNDVLVRFAILEDGKPMKAVDVEEVFSRLPDLLGTLNSNIPYQVLKSPTAVVISPLAALADVSGWLAAVVVLAVLCVLLASLLAAFLKKPREVGGVAAPSGNIASSEKGQPSGSGLLPPGPRLPTDVEVGGVERSLPARGADSPNPLRPTAASLSYRPPRSRKRSVLKKEQRKRRNELKANGRHRVTPMESSPEESAGDRDPQVLTPEIRQESIGGRYEPAAHVHAEDPPSKDNRINARFRSTVTPLPPLQPQRIMVSTDRETLERGSTEGDIKTRGLDKQTRAQMAVHRERSADPDADLWRKTNVEHLRNKKRQRDKLRESQREAAVPKPGQGGSPGVSVEVPVEGRRRRAGTSQREKELAAWRRVQAQISSLLEPVVPGVPGEEFRTMQGASAFPRGPAYFNRHSQPTPMDLMLFEPPMATGHPFYSAGRQQFSPQVPNNMGLWSQPWRTAQIPNTRHNAEFLRSLQVPPQPYYYPPSSIPSFYPPPSDLPGSLPDQDQCSTSSGTGSPEPPQSSQAPQSAQMEGVAALPPGAPLLSTGSQNYLQLLTSLKAPQVPPTDGTRQRKKKKTKDHKRS